MRVTDLLRFVIAFVVTTGCGSSKGPQPGAAQTDLEAAVNRAASAASLYSFRYYSGTRTLFVHLPAYDPALTCASVAAINPSEYAGMWYLELYVNWPAPVTATSIGATYPPTSDTAAAYLDIARYDSAEKRHWTVPALDGTLSFESAPSDEAGQLAGTPVRGHMNFRFPKQPLALISCAGGASVDGDGGPSVDGDGGPSELATCICADEGGQQSSCESVAGVNCCKPASDTVDTFSFDFSASACGFLCSTTPGDANNCGELAGAS